MEVVRKPLSQITQASRNVTLVVTLESVLPEATSASGTVNYQRLLFRDKAGTEIPATLVAEDIELFSDVFHVGRDYEITNAVIAPIHEDIRRGSQNFEIIIRSITTVVELPPSNMGNHSYIVPLDSSLEYVDHQGRIDILGVAVHVTSLRKVRRKYSDAVFDARDIVLVDRSMKPTMLTLWKAFVSVEAQAILDIVDTHPTVLATHVSPSKYRGGSWNTTFFSAIRFDYDDPRATTLRQWEKENEAEIALIADHLKSNVGESSRTILPIAALIFQEDGATVWVKGKVTNVINPDNCVYASCSVCKKETKVVIGEKFSCFQTKTPHIGTSTYRFNLHIRFEDESSAIKLTLFQELAEKVLKRTAGQVYCLLQEERLSLINDFIDITRGRLCAVKLLAKKFGASKKQLKFIAQYVEEVEE